MSISYIDGIIRRKRADLDDLERFARTPAYDALLQAARKRGLPDQEQWLANWLIQPACGLNTRPLDLAWVPGGFERLLGQVASLKAQR